MKKEVFLECGCCGCYHPKSFIGDCRDDKNRYHLYEVISKTIITLEEQRENKQRR